MIKDILLKLMFFALGTFIAYWFMKDIDVFQAYDVGQSLFEKEYIWPSQPKNFKGINTMNNLVQFNFNQKIS